MRRMHLVATVVGLACYLAVQSIQPTLKNAVMGFTLEDLLWQMPLHIVGTTVLILLPGFVAGCFVRNFGIGVGFIVGTVGALLAPLVLGARAGQSPSVISHQWFIALSLALGAGLICAAAGAAGQVVRSNISLKRTRGG